MANIVFTETPCSKYAAQGGAPSGKAGYDVWIQLSPSELSFLGYIKEEDLLGMVAYYQLEGDSVYIARQRPPLFPDIDNS